jgi:CHASE3 domain sensor protein
MLMIAFLIGLFLLAAAGQSRLNVADDRIHRSEVRERALDEYFALIAEAESEQRGYLLTGEKSYLDAYNGAAAKIAPALDRLADSYANLSESAADIRQLRNLSGEKVAELQKTLALYQENGPSLEQSVVRTDVAKRTSDAIAKIIGIMRDEESIDLSVETARWRSMAVAQHHHRRHDLEYRARPARDRIGLCRHAAPRPPSGRSARSETRSGAPSRGKDAGTDRTVHAPAGRLRTREIRAVA